MIILKKKLSVIACMHACMHTRMARLAIYACNLRTCLLVSVCACMHAHVTSIKCFLTLNSIHYFFQEKHDISKQNKMSNITTEKKDLEQSTDIDHFFTLTVRFPVL